LEKVPGVRSATASHEAGTAKVLLEAEVSDEALTRAVEAIGYIVDGVD
jgi:copper chaperone CopZ